MKLYFKAAHIPELAGLTRQQRKAVFQCALEAFYFEDRSRVFFGTRWVLAGLLCGMLAGWSLVFFAGFSHPKLVLGLCGLTGVLASVFFAQQAHFELLRPYLQRVLAERKDEIAQIPSSK